MTTAFKSLCSLSMAPVKWENSRCQSIGNCPTAPYWKQEGVHSLSTVPLSNGASSQDSTCTEEVSYPNRISKLFHLYPMVSQPQPSRCSYPHLLLTQAARSPTPHLSDLYRPGYQDSPSCGSLTLCDTPNFMHGECRDSSVNHSLFNLLSKKPKENIGEVTDYLTLTLRTKKERMLQTELKTGTWGQRQKNDKFDASLGNLARICLRSLNAERHSVQ